MSEMGEKEMKESIANKNAIIDLQKGRIESLEAQLREREEKESKLYVLLGTENEKREAAEARIKELEEENTDLQKYKKAVYSCEGGRLDCCTASFGD